MDEVRPDLPAQLPQLGQLQVLQVHRVFDRIQQRRRRLGVALAPGHRVDGAIVLVRAPLVQPGALRPCRVGPSRSRRRAEQPLTALRLPRRCGSAVAVTAAAAGAAPLRMQAAYSGGEAARGEARVMRTDVTPACFDDQDAT